MSKERIERIRACLEAAFHPNVLEIHDESHMHVGHVGARSGKGHFRVHITCSQFQGVPLKRRHQMVYEALDELMKTDIHALSLIADLPDSSSAQRN